MDSPEKRVTDALDEFEELVSAGVSVEAAAEEAARANDLRPDVVLKRARDRFGDLNTLAERTSSRRQSAARAARVSHAVFEYNQLFFGPGRAPEFVDVTDWVESQLGFPLTFEENSWAVGQMNEAFNRSMFRDFDHLLKRSGRIDAQD